VYDTYLYSIELATLAAVDAIVRIVNDGLLGTLECLNCISLRVVIVQGIAWAYDPGQDAGLGLDG